MDLILEISFKIIIIGGAFVVVLASIALVYVISILVKINSIIKDLYGRYQIVMEVLSSPIKIIYSFISKFK